MSPVSAEVPTVVDVDWRFAEAARACSEVGRYRIASPLFHFAQHGFTLLIAGVLVFTILVAYRSDVDTAEYLSQSLPWIIIMLLYLVLRLASAPLGAWKMRRNNPSILAGTRHTISSAAYQVRCGQIESTAQWGGLLRVVESKEFFLMFPAKHAAFYLPKRVLSQEQSVTVRSIMHLQAGDRFLVRT